MGTSATELFEFFAGHPVFTMTSHVIECAPFSILRRCVRRIILALEESALDEALDVSSTLRAMLSEWLTVPVPFDHEALDRLTTLGTPAEFGRRWGTEVRAWYDEALGTVDSLLGVESPLRGRLREVIRNCNEEQGHAFRIYCHRRAIPHYLSLFQGAGEQWLAPEHFVSSLASYRSSAIVHTMIKVGPLRSRGWGAVPDALLTAPKFVHLTKVVWVGCRDEQDFGYDPVAGSKSQAVTSPSGEARIAWRSQEIGGGPRIPNSPYQEIDVDDLSELARRGPPQEYRRAIFVQIDENHGILYPPLSRVLSYDPQQQSQDGIAERLPGDSLIAGMYVILPVLEDEEGRAHAAEDGHYSRIWKRLLKAEMARGIDGLVTRLKITGVDLRRLRSRLNHWCRSASTVIPAPQQREHFRLLMDVLGLEAEVRSSGKQVITGKAWLYAWNEIARSRGEAIHSGMIEHEVIDQELMRFLRDRDTMALLRKCNQLDSFSVELTGASELFGEVRFHKVLSVEGGFSAPEHELKQLVELELVDQWRA
jgi:hypothetical protein